MCPGRGGRHRDLGVAVDTELAAVAAALDLLPQLPVGAYLSINASARTICSPQLAELFGKAPVERLLLELTESTDEDRTGQLVRALTKLRLGGLRLAIDDAGSGYGSLRAHPHAGPEVIKFDIDLVRHVDTDPARRALVDAMTRFASAYGASVVAEGIETAAELHTLRELGAPLGQGYLLGRPGPPSGARATMRTMLPGQTRPTTPLWLHTRADA